MAADERNLARDIQTEFLDELKFLLEACEESYLKIEDPEFRVEELAKIFRLAHSIKGGGAAVGFSDLAAFAHAMEDCLAVLRTHPNLVDTAAVTLLLKCGDVIKARIDTLRMTHPPAWEVADLKEEMLRFSKGVEEKRREAGIPPVPLVLGSSSEGGMAQNHRSESHMLKVDSQRLEKLLNTVGELVVIKSQILNEAFKQSGNTRLNTMASVLDKTIRELQARALSMRMTPLKNLFLKVQRVARDLSVRLKKPIDFHTEGGEIEMDRTLVEQLSDPLIHLIRNSLDHGVESAEVRRRAGKAENGVIHLSATQRGGKLVLRLCDDGAGINRERVVHKAKELGLLDSEVDPRTLADGEVFAFLCAAGFSTADRVTDISGRGVGMNVVNENLEAIRGKMEIESEQGKGTNFRITLPLTTSITDGMLVSIDSQVYILPMDGIIEMVEFQAPELVPTPAGKTLLNIRGRLFPFFPLGAYLNSAYASFKSRPSPNKDAGNMVVLFEHDTGQAALCVDAVLGQAQVVLKPLKEGIHEGTCIAGAAILGDGKVALMLDINGLFASK